MTADAIEQLTFEDCLMRLVGFASTVQLVNVDDRNVYSGSALRKVRRGVVEQTKTYYCPTLIELYRLLARDAELLRAVDE